MKFSTLWKSFADLSRNATLVKLSATLREKHLRKLLGNQRFRAQLDSRGKDALWKKIDRLTSRVFWADMTEKSYVLCEQHKANIFRTQSKSRNKGFQYLGVQAGALVVC
jgi:hypothetical protein